MTPEASRRRRVAIVRCRAIYEEALQRESAAFREAGFDVDVIMLQSVETAAGVTDVDGVSVRRLRGTKSRGSKAEYIVNYGLFMLRAGRELAAEHRRRRFDLVHVLTMPDFLVFSTLWLRMRGVRVSLFMKEPSPELAYTLYGSNLIERVMRAVERLSIRYANVVFAVTPEHREAYVARGADPDKVHVVLNCPAAENFESPTLEPRVDPERFVLVCHGTIEERWGHETMIRALNVVRDEIPNVELRILGRGDYADDMLRIVAELGLEDYFTYLGWVDFDEVVAEIGGADVGLVAQLPSPYSHLVHTQKMFEYIMVDTPCIASRLRATEAAFDDTELLFYEPGDHESLARAILSLHASPELGQKLTRNARRRYEAGYTWESQKHVLVEHATRTLR